MRNIIRIGAGTDGRNRFVAIALGVALAAGPAAMMPAAALAAPATDAAAASTTAGATITLQGADGASLAGHSSVTANPDPSPSVSYSPTSLLPCSYHSHMCSVNDPSSCSSYMTVSSSAILELDVLGEHGGRVVFVFDPPCRVVHPQHLPAQFGERVTVLDARVAGEHVDLA